MVSFKRILLANLLFLSAVFSLGAMKLDFVATEEKPLCGMLVLIQQPQTRIQQDACSCGLHAVNNLFCFMTGGSIDSVIKQLKNDEMFDKTHLICNNVNKSIDFDVSESGQLVANLLKGLRDHYEQLQDQIDHNVTIMDQTQADILNLVIFELLNKDQLNEQDSEELALVIKNIKKNQHNAANDNLEQDVQNFKKMLLEKRERLYQGHAQYFLVSPGGHWIALKFEWLPEGSGKMVVWVAESLNRKATNYRVICQILRLMKNLSE